MQEQELMEKIRSMKPEAAARHLQERMVARGRMGVIHAGQKPEGGLEFEADDPIAAALARVAGVPFSVKP